MSYTLDEVLDNKGDEALDLNPSKSSRSLGI